MVCAWCFEEKLFLCKKFLLLVRPTLTLKNPLWSGYHFRMKRACSCKGRETMFFASLVGFFDNLILFRVAWPEANAVSVAMVLGVHTLCALGRGSLFPLVN